MTWETVAAWEASAKNVLRILEAHLADHDFILGGRPSVADYGLLGPLYAHLWQDPVPGAMIKRDYPRVEQWARRCHGGEPGTTNGGEWLADDAVPDTVIPLLQVFFTEMWPVLRSTCAVLRRYRETIHPSADIPVPSKSFSPSHPDQTGTGPLVHGFSLPFGADGRRGGVSTGRRMVVPYQVWMLQRLEPTVHHGGPSVAALLARFEGAATLSALGKDLAGCRLRKIGGRMHWDLDDASDQATGKQKRS